MTTLTERELRDRLADAMPDLSADGPLHPAVLADVNLGRRLLARRRRALGIAVLVPATLVAAGLTTLLSAPDPSPSTSAAAHASVPNSDTELINACRTGDISTTARNMLWGAGEPTVAASARAAGSAMLALRSADGTQWGECLVQTAWGRNHTTANPSLDTSAHAYDLDGASTDVSAITNLTPSDDTLRGCHAEETCTTFAVLWVDRLPAEVTAIEVRTGDGHTSRVYATDGFFAFGYTGELPHAVTMNRMYDEFPGFVAIEQITYLDSAGRPLASGVANVTPGSTSYDPPPGSTSLGAYPSRRASALL